MQTLTLRQWAYLPWDNMSGGAWNINNNACIVATAMKEYFVNGTLPEETIAASNNILDFQVIAKVGGKYSGCYQLIGGEKVPVQKVNRVYACKNKGYGKIYKTHATTGKDAKVPSLPDHCIVDNNNELSIDVVDREWYVKLARNRYGSFRCESTTEEYQKNKFAKEKVISVVQLRRTRTWKVQQKKW